MPAVASTASAESMAVAPDGIAIHSFALPPAALVGVVEGRIPRGRFGIHRHLSLEQYTYVVSGSVTAVTGNEEHASGRVCPLTPGDLLLTLPGESLQFVNTTTETARVLFICAPPYPPDDSDTRTLAQHGPPADHEMKDAIARLDTVRAELNAVIDGRIAALRHGT